jgi:hypothetical protein
MVFVPPSDLIVHETLHWRINHRVDCAVPGYLMIGAKDSAAIELSDVVPPALSQVGHLLSFATAILMNRLEAKKVYVSRYGHDSGHTVHFHIIRCLFMAACRVSRRTRLSWLTTPRWSRFNTVHLARILRKQTSPALPGAFRRRDSPDHTVGI